MNCCAPVTGCSTQHRADRSTDTRCHRRGSELVMPGKWFCYQHAPEWREHYEIVERIRAIPNRDIQKV